MTDYLPEFRMADKRYRDITVRMTLNHSSGLPGTEGSNTFCFAPNDRALQETLETHLVQSSLSKELPGYVNFQGIKKIETPEFAGMPFDAIRDQTELTLIDRCGTTWARVSDLLYSPAGEIRTLKAGDDMILSFVKPEKGRVIVFTPDRTAHNDSAVDTGDVYVTKGSFVECEGFARDVFTLKGTRGSASNTD